MLLEAVPEATNLIAELLQAYGPTGAAFGGLLMMLIRANKRCEKQNKELSQRVQQLEERQLDEHREMIGEYTSLVKENGSVISKLTGCLSAIKDTLDRIDRRTEEK